ncbi:MAG: hypothetical protein ABII23_02110 [bacterium]
MKIIIEIESKKELILKELKIILDVLQIDSLIANIIIPKDFDATVRQLTNEKRFDALQKNTQELVVGKIIQTP